MRPNVVSEAGLSTRLGQWWEGIPFITSVIVIVCGALYLACIFVGYDSFAEICFLPSAVIHHFQVYRIFTSILFHGSLMHVMFNMLALIPLGTELERTMGSVRMLHVIMILATSNALFHLFIALLVAHNPFWPYEYLMNECAIGFSGVLFSMIVIETTLSGVQSRSVFGLFNVPAKWYAWILLIVFQLLMTNVSLLGHLCGILSGFAYTYGLFNYILPGSPYYSKIESSSLLSACVRRPKFILCAGGNSTGYLPTHRSPNTTTPSSLISGDIWRNLSSWMPRRETPPAQPAQDSRFPGRGRTLLSSQDQPFSALGPDSGIQARLPETNLRHSFQATAGNTGMHIPDRRHPDVDNSAAVAPLYQDSGNFDVDIQKLVEMGFERTQVEVALLAADGDSNMAVEILMTPQS